MIGSAIKPNDRTYASLINACARAGDKPLALRVYRKAQREGCAATLMVYSAAVHACVHAEGGCDADAAMQIYADMQRCAPCCPAVLLCLEGRHACGRTAPRSRLQPANQALEQASTTDN